MNHATNAYGLWSLVLINSAVFIIFAFSFVKPKTKTDWRSLGAFSAFVVALFTEMYGFPLTIYFLSGWLGQRYPGVDLLSHESGHLWSTLLGFEGNPHFNPIHILSNVLIFIGSYVLAKAWPVLHAAQARGELATEGPYAKVRHPQYAGFILIMIGFLVQWPTIPTLVMFPVLVWVYSRLALREEREAAVAFADRYQSWAAVTPRFIPRFGGRVPGTTGGGAS